MLLKLKIVSPENWSYEVVETKDELNGEMNYLVDEMGLIYPTFSENVEIRDEEGLFIFKGDKAYTKEQLKAYTHNDLEELGLLTSYHKINKDVDDKLPTEEECDRSPLLKLFIKIIRNFGETIDLLPEEHEAKVNIIRSLRKLASEGKEPTFAKLEQLCIYYGISSFDILNNSIDLLIKNKKESE